LVLIIGIFFVIKGSTAPLLINNAFFNWLLYSEPNDDKTLYNIGISIIAAYLFYLVQVFIPESKKFREQVSSFSEYHRHVIFLLNQYIIAWKQFLKEDGVCIFHEFNYTINEIGHSYTKDYTYSLTKEIYKETIDELKTCFDAIIKSPEYINIDSKYKIVIAESKCKINGLLIFMYDQFPYWHDNPLECNDHKLLMSIVIDDMERVQKRLSSIEKYYIELVKIEPYEGKPDWIKELERSLL
jgi:hypothetical protein